MSKDFVQLPCHFFALRAFLPAVWALLLAAAMPAGATFVTVTSPTTSWNAVPYANFVDPIKDQQTGQADGDIVGNASSPGFYTQFDGVDLYFRVRLGSGGTKPTPKFSGLLWIGIDGNNDGALDLFIGVNNQGSNSSIQFNDPGPGLNNSPSTTSIVNPAAATVAQSTSNYNLSYVSTTLQPQIVNTDINGDGTTDAFLSFRVAFYGAAGTATLQGMMKSLANLNVNATTGFGYVVATSTQTNSLNQDIGGIDNRNYNQNSTWVQLGGISQRVNADGTPYTEPVPEASTMLLMGSGLVMAVAFQKRLRR